MPRAHYRVRTAVGQLGYTTHFVNADGHLRSLGSGQVAMDDEAADVAALAILGDQLRGDWPRTWHLVDAFEREFLSAAFTERTIEPAPWRNGRRGTSPEVADSRRHIGVRNKPARTL
jgi:hypothetical protein